MDGAARSTWRRIYAGDAARIRIREDTLTEINLLDLHLRHPEVVVYRFNQSEERTSGADWEWYVGSDIAGWFALRVQAKRMDGLEYRQLQHPGAPGDDFQYDTLIKSSSLQSLPTFPVYVFFNGWATGWPSGVDWWGCPNLKPLGQCRHADPTDFGCAAVSARLVRHLHAGRGVEGRRVDQYLSVSVPWSWLFGLPPIKSKGSRFNAGLYQPTTAKALAWQHAQIEAVRGLDALATAGAEFEPDLMSNISRTYWEQVRDLVSSPFADTPRLGDLPAYARQLLELHYEGVDGEIREEALLNASGLHRNVIITNLGESDAAQ